MTATFRLFAVLWALAGLFHVWGSVRIVGFADDPSWVGASHLVIAVLAVAVLALPGRVDMLLGLCVVELWSVWLELPVVGNHWVLVGLVDVGILFAAASCWARRATVAPSRLAARALPVARWTLLAFYGFAAFAKLNSAFVDPGVSCGSFFFREAAVSLRLERVAEVAAGSSWLAWAAALGTLVVELSVSLLLVVRRTRLVGVVVGLVFHGLIALDQTHSFSDFSSVLTALFVLFLPVGFAPWAGARVGERLASLLRAATVLAAGGLTGMRLARPGPLAARLFTDGRALAWVAEAVVVLALVLAYLARVRPRPAAAAGRALTIPVRWLAVVPLLAVANGLTPYLELKTAFGWNMYSNLVTVDGDSNHFLVRRTLPFTDVQADLVRVLASSDPALALYANQGYDLPWLQFRGYLSGHRDVSVRYERAGVVHDLRRAADDPELVRPLSTVEEKLLVFRAVDRQDPPRCQPTFLPAH